MYYVLFMEQTNSARKNSLSYYNIIITASDENKFAYNNNNINKCK